MNIVHIIIENWAHNLKNGFLIIDSQNIEKWGLIFLLKKIKIFKILPIFLKY